MAALYSFMLDRFNAGDYDSSLVSNILKFVVKFETLDAEMLEMTKLSKILQRFAKKATNESKNLSQSILSNAVAASAKKKADAKAGKVASPQATDSPGTATRKEMVAGVKRTREGEIAPQPPIKKVARVASKPLALQNAERRKALEASQAAKDGARGSAGAATTASSAAATKGKVAVAAPPKSAVFSALLSASKRPGTSNAARAAAAAKDKAAGIFSPTTTSQVKESVKKESPPRNASVTIPLAKSTTSSFLGLLADMEKKPEKETKKDNDIPNETDEQRSKRLRKEVRRRLRVTWKAETDLVETRLFTHDPDEEIGHNDNQMRDAGDTSREGEMLKLHQGVDIDEDDDDDSVDELEEYTPPSEVDFSVIAGDIPDTDPLQTNSIKFGGPIKPVSESSTAQDNHERDTVMATYVTRADRPPTPKEPDDDDDGNYMPPGSEKLLGEPNETIKRREKEYIARQAKLNPNPSGYAAPPKAGVPAQMQGGEIPAELQLALSMFGKQHQPTTQPHVAPTATLPNSDLLLESVHKIRQQLTGQPVQPPQPQYQPPVQNAALPGNINLAALLASLQTAQAQPQPTSLTVGLGSNPNPFPGASSDHSRKHARGDSNEYNELGRKGGTKKKKDGGDSSRPYNYKTMVCNFWEKGLCRKGDDCTYRHGDE